LVLSQASDVVKELTERTIQIHLISDHGTIPRSMDAYATTSFTSCFP